jgi:hypothetical protein
MWTFHRGKTAGDWTQVWGEARGLVIFAWVHAREFDCDAGSGGGFGTHGTSGVGEGFVEARSVTLPAGTALFSAPDGGARIAVLHARTNALERLDGALMLKVSSGGTSLSLHDVFAVPRVTSTTAPRQLSGFGSVYSRSDEWPHACSDGGLDVTACFDLP